MDERDTLQELTEGILGHTHAHEVQVLYINDGSTDGSGEELDRIVEEHSNVQVIHFLENRGKSAAFIRTNICSQNPVKVSRSLVACRH